MLSTADLVRIYGDPGKGKPNPAWERANIVDCHGTATGARVRPAMPGVPAAAYFRCHRLVEPHFREAFTRVARDAPDFVLTRAGGYVFRHMRHDPRKPLSQHSRGIAADLNAAANSARYFKRGQAPAAWSPAWYKLWPIEAGGLTPAVVAAFKACGFRWGGDWDHDDQTTDEVYVDPMHVEFTLVAP